MEDYFVKEKTCRACAKTGAELSLFAEPEQESPDGTCISNMIIECTMYTILENDELPHLICCDCNNKVRNAYNFKKQYEESQQKLLAILQSIKEVSIAANFNPNNEENIPEEIFEDNSNLRQKSTRNCSTKKYPCDKCYQTFTKSEQLKEHMKAEHKAHKHSCTICSKEFVRLGHLTRHMNKHRIEEVAEDISNKDDITQPNTKEDVFIKIENEPSAVPSVQSGSVSKVESEPEDVDFDFGTDNEYDPEYNPDEENETSVKVEQVPTESKINSDDSPTAIEPEVSLIKEEKHRLPLDSNRRFQCDQCHKAFKRKAHLKQHSLCHTKAKPYQCTICQKKFGRPDNLKVHMSNHGQKQFQCNSCDRSFGQAYLLKRHKDQTHSEEKPFLCSICGQRFVRNGDLAVHMRRHTGEKPYKCQYCHKGFTRSTEVYVHERYHTGEKKHVCSTCGKAFQRPYNLLVHVRTHTGERPYQCPHCPKNFAQCSDLKAHIRRHTGERYKCEQCGMGFIHVFVLNQHKLSVHGIEVQSRIKRIAKLETDTQ